MITLYLRSSSINTWQSICQFRAALGYGLGIPDSPHKISADLGNVTHKALELLALKKFNEQEGNPTFTEDETGGTYDTATLTPQEALDAGWLLYKTKSPQWDWSAEEYKQATKWMWKVLDHEDGMFSPLKRTIVKPEQYFDFPIEESWASYSYENPWGKEPITGQLRVRGTMDLIVDVPWMEDTIEYIDWKTGKYARTDWKGKFAKTKGYRQICNDMQLRLYHLALRKLFPEKKYILMSIFYIQAGGPYSIPLGDDSIPETLSMIRKVYEEMKDTSFPKRLDRSDRKCSWCRYGREKQEGTDKFICDFMYDELKQIGLTKLTAKYGDKNAASVYTGGGRANVTVEKGESK